MSGQLEKALKDSCVEINDGTKKTFDDVEGLGEAWKTNDIFLNHATKLDDSDLCYMLPDMHEALCALTGQNVDYIKARTKNGAIEMNLLGFYEGPQPMGPFWQASFPENLEGNAKISPRVARLLKCARAIEADLERNGGEMKQPWIDSYKKSYEYITLHRRTVRGIGDILGIDMNDHDLTKSRIVQLAMGGMFHWHETREDTSEQKTLKELLFDCIKAGHLESEDHHPEYERVQQGPVAVDKLFCDRLAVHSQKEKPDGQKGWGINPNFIPDEHKPHFEEFRKEHGGKDLYEALNKAKSTPINPPA